MTVLRWNAFAIPHALAAPAACGVANTTLISADAHHPAAFATHVDDADPNAFEQLDDQSPTSADYPAQAVYRSVTALTSIIEARSAFTPDTSFRGAGHGRGGAGDLRRVRRLGRAVRLHRSRHPAADPARPGGVTGVWGAPARLRLSPTNLSTTLPAVIDWTATPVRQVLSARRGDELPIYPGRWRRPGEEGP